MVEYLYYEFWSWDEDDEGTHMDELNALLNEGWRPLREIPLGPLNDVARVLVLLTRNNET